MPTKEEIQYAIGNAKAMAAEHRAAAATLDVLIEVATAQPQEPPPPPPPPPPGGGLMQPRPAASKGTGFYVVGSKLYDANGKEFRMRGTNKTHQDVTALSLKKTKSNATRWIIYFFDDPERAIRDMSSPNIGGSTSSNCVQIPGFWDGTCQSGSELQKMTDRWVRDAAKYQQFEKYMILNIANEWGSDSLAWSKAYITAISRIRSAGFNGCLMVDAPGCGQNGAAIAVYGKPILDADPQRNVIFSWHIYGGVCDIAGGQPRTYNEQIDLIPTMDALRNSGLCVVIGEFGPGRNIGPSPTLITPERIVEVAEQYGFGWLTWSWDDNNLRDAKADDGGFCGVRDVVDPNAQLTKWGEQMVALWDKYGATKASIF